MPRSTTLTRTTSRSKSVPPGEQGESPAPLAARIEELEKGLRAILPWKLREIAEWFDTVDKLLDALSVNGLPFREQYEMPRKSEIQEDVRRWADTVEALVRAALGGEE